MPKDVNKQIAAAFRKLQQTIAEVLAEQRTLTEMVRRRSATGLETSHLSTLNSWAQHAQSERSRRFNVFSVIGPGSISVAALVLATMSYLVAEDSAREHEITSAFPTTVTACVSLEDFSLRIIQ